MTKKCISMVISLLILLSCVMPFGTAFAADVADAADEGFTYVEDFSEVTIPAGTTDKAVVEAATGWKVSYDTNRTADFEYKVENGKFVIASTANSCSKGDGVIDQTHDVKLDYTFPKTVKTGVIKAEMKIMYVSGSGNWNVGALTNGTVFTSTVNHQQSKLEIPEHDPSTPATLIDLWSPPRIDKYANFHIVYERLTEDDNWTEKRYLIKADGTKQLVYSNEYPNDTYDEFTGYRFLSTYATRHVFSSSFDDFKIEYTPASAIWNSMSFSQDFSAGALDGITSLAQVGQETGLTFVPDSLSFEGAYQYTTKNGYLEAVYDNTKTSSKGYCIFADYDFPASLSTGKFTVDMKVWGGTTGRNARRYFLGPKSGSNAGTTYNAIITTANVSMSGQEMDVTSGKAINAFTTKGGKFHLRMELSRLSTNEDWTVAIYNVANPNVPMLIRSATYSKDTYKAVDGLRLMGSWGAADNPHTDYLDDISISYTPASELNGTELTVDFEGVTKNADADANVLSAETGLSIVKPTGSTLDTTGGNLKYSTNTNTASFEIFYKLPVPIKTGFAEASYIIERAKTSGSETFLSASDNGMVTTYKNDGTPNYYASQNWTKVMEYNGRWINEDESFVKAARATADGKTRLRAVWSRPDKESDWTFVLYDETYINPVTVYKYTVSAEKLTNISNIKLFRNYCVGKDEEVIIDDIKIKTSSVYDNRFTLKQNFDALDDAEYTAAQAQALRDASSTGGVQLIVDPVNNPDVLTGIKDGKLFLDYNGKADEFSSVTAKANLPLSVYYGVVEASMTVDAYETGEGGETHFFNIANTDGQSVSSFKLDAIGSYFRDDVNDGIFYTDRVKDNGLFRIRVVISRPDTESNWTLKFYDDNAGGCFATREVLKENLTKIDMVTFFNAYTRNHTLEADDFKLTASSWYADAMKVSAGFGNLPNGKVSQGALKAATGLSLTSPGVSTIENGALKVLSDISGVNYYPSLNFDFPVEIEKGTITASFKVPALADGQEGFAGRTTSMFNVTDVNKTSSGAAIWHNTVIATKWGVGDKVEKTIDEEAGTKETIASGRLNATPTRDNDGTGAYNFRAVITRENAEDAWTMTVYDDTPATPVAIATRTFTAAALESLTLVKPTAIPNENTSVLVDDVKITYADGTELPEREEAEEEEPVIVVKPSNIVLDEESLYITDENGQINSIAGLTEIYVEIDASNPKGANESFYIVLAAYQEGRLLKASMSDKFTPTAEGIGCDAELTEFENADDIKIFFLSDITEMRPVADMMRVSEVLSPAQFQ